MKSGNKVDFVISAGAACRPAYYTRLLGMRKFSSPCDWMMSYSLADFLDVLRSEARNMFKNAYIDHKCRWVVDKDNGMISMHDFSCDHALDEQLPAFYEMVQRRARKTLSEIQKSKRVGIVMNRNISSGDLVEFAEKLSAIFPHCHFCIVNMKDSPNESSVVMNQPKRSNYFSVYEVTFNDGHPNGRDKATNPSFWLGNTDVWMNALPQIFSVKDSYYRKVKRYVMAVIRRCISAARHIFIRR